MTCQLPDRFDVPEWGITGSTIDIDLPPHVDGVEPGGSFDHPLLLSTACWRRHVVHWRVHDGQLWLQGLQGDRHLRDGRPIAATWVNGWVFVDHGDVHGDLAEVLITDRRTAFAFISGRLVDHLGWRAPPLGLGEALDERERWERALRAQPANA